MLLRERERAGEKKEALIIIVGGMHTHTHILTLNKRERETKKKGS